MASSPEHRGEAVRITWILGGRRGGAKQSVTFTGPPDARLKLALTAKQLVESRGHNISRAECLQAILGVPVEPETVVPTFRQWAQQWITKMRDDAAVQPDVVRRYESMLKLRVIPYLGHKQLTEITRDDIKEWVKAMRSSRATYGSRNRRAGKRLLAPNTVIFVYVVVSACLGAAVPRWIAVNPAARAQGERRNSLGLPPPQPSPGMFLTGEELQAILDNCPPALRDIVFVASRTGMRIGELVALEARHVVFARDGGATVLVRGKLKSTASERDIPVGRVVAELLARRVAGRRPSDLVLTDHRGLRWDQGNLRNTYWNRAIAGARRCPEHPPPSPPKSRSGPTRRWNNDEVSTCGCPGVLARKPRFHDLRHTHASVLIHEGWHFKKIQRRLGHARFQTTMDVYGHLVDLGDSGELESLENYFAPAKAVIARPRRSGSAPVRGRFVRVRTSPARRSTA